MCAGGRKGEGKDVYKACERGEKDHQSLRWRQKEKERQGKAGQVG